MAVQAKLSQVCYGDEKRFPNASCCLCYGHINPEQSESTEKLGEEEEGNEQEEKHVINYHRCFCHHLLATASSLATIQRCYIDFKPSE